MVRWVWWNRHPREGRSAGETGGVLFASSVRGKTPSSTVPNLTQPVP